VGTAVLLPRPTSSPGTSVPIIITFSQPVNNFKIRINDIDPSETIQLSTIPTSPFVISPVSGSPVFGLAGGLLDALGNSNTIGCVEFTNPITSVSLTYNRPGSGFGLLLDSLMFNITNNNNAGIDTNWNVCEATNYNLNNELTLTADVGGNWYNNSYAPVTMPINISNTSTYHYIIGSGLCVDTSNYNIQIAVNSNAGIDTNVVLCNSNSVDLFTLLKGNPVIGGTWYDQNNLINLMPIDPQVGKYIYVVGSNPCFDTAYINISLQQINVSFNVVPYIIYAQETVVNFTSSSLNTLNYQWKIDGVLASSYPDFNHTFNAINSYEVCLLANNSVCRDSVCREINVIDKSYIYIPNTFSPNGDGYNEEFGPYITGKLVYYEFYIFDRWGEIVFESDVQSKFWDGIVKNKKSQQGVYTWCLKYQKVEGIEMKTMYGHVFILK
jgi:gliding motility-associated-like protein